MEDGKRKREAGGVLRRGSIAGIGRGVPFDGAQGAVLSIS